MKKLYFFSKTKLQFIEVKNFKSKLAAYIVLAVIFFSTLTLSGYFLYFTSSGQNSGSLKTENKLLKKKIEEISDLYKGLNAQLEQLKENNDVLRMSANLPPVSEDERKLGVGGGNYFDINYDFFSDESDLKLNEAITYIDEVTRKISFEKDLYNKVSKKLIENQKLYDAIPAIKPSEGYASFTFGMRMHPILKINKMHEGIDIMNDVGTPVYATGKGTVDFVGRKGGYGLAVEINHGFGYRTVYAHLSKSNVVPGQKVSRGTMIAKSGNSGLSTGPHVHYEIHHNGIKLNPMDFFFDDLGFLELTKK